ncbi:FIG01058277: hypothetical protein [hydrothermal vent metagenome]|uniref:2TM domain-containing protein n=1 Tax=hydrothermal vent metagenome TaxID=652676 RepID=A0A3B0ZI40_9ZZZZ
MNKQKQYLFDNPKNVKRVIHSLYIICIVLFILDFIINRHIYINLENLWGFYAVYGFIACVLLVLIAKWMRTFLMREESYYTSQEKPYEVKATQTKNGTENVDK